MIPYIDIMGAGRHWVGGIFALQTYCSLQFWLALLIIAGCVAQLHIGHKYAWPPSPGRLTILGYRIGIVLDGGYHGGWLSIRLGDVGACLDFLMHIVGRLGLALEAASALIAIDDVLASPTSPRPIAVGLMAGIVMIQARALTACTPREKK